MSAREFVSGLILKAAAYRHTCDEKIVVVLSADVYAAYRAEIGRGGNDGQPGLSRGESRQKRSKLRW